MVDIFKKEGIAKDIFALEGIKPPSISEQNSIALSPPKIETVPEVDAYVQEDKNKYEQLAKARMPQEQIDAIKAKGAIGFLEARKFLDYEQVAPGGGLLQAANTAIIYSAAKKLEKGEDLTVTENEALNNYLNKQIEINLRGFKVGGGIMYGAAQMPAFMIEFAATAGAGKTAQVVAEKAVTKGAEKIVVKAASKAAMAKAAGVAANVAVRTAALPTMYAPAYAERRLNDYMAVTDKGEMILQQSEESPAISALKAYGYTSIEVASELSGAAIGKHIIDPLARTLKTPLITAASKLPVKVRQGLYDAYKKLQPNATVSKVFSAGGWNGMLEELGEERVADVLRETLNLATEQDYTMEDYLNGITPSKDQLLIEAGIISIAGGVKTSSNLTMNILMQDGLSAKEAKETAQNMSSTEQEIFVSESLKKPEPMPIQDPFVAAQASAEQEVNDNESGFNRFYRDFVNGLQPIETLTKEAQAKGAEIEKGENPFYLSHTYAGVIGQVEHNLRVGTTALNKETGQFEVTGKSLKAVLDDFDNSVAHIEGSRDQREQDFNDYLIARRTLEDLKDREDVEVAEKDIQKSNDTMYALAAKYGDEFNWFDTFGKEMYEYQQRVLKNLVDSDVLSQEQYDDILSKNPNYIPFQRVLEDEAFKDFISTKGVFTDATSRKVIKKIQGSDKDIKTVQHSVIANTAKIIDIAYRNRVAKGIADLAEIMPEYVQKVPVPMKKIVVADPETGKEIETYRPTGMAPKGTITVSRNGKKEYYRVSKPLLEAVNQLGVVRFNATMQMLFAPLRWSASALRAGATLVPEFWVRNVLRDQSTAFLQSPVRPTPIDTIKGLAAVIGKTDLYNDWMRNGGSFNSYMALDDKGLERAYKELFRPQGKFAKYTRNPLNILNDISMGLEKATRVGAFRKARDSGIVGIEAALLAREATLDFSRGGVVSKGINQYVPFFNAGVQSVDKLLRTFKENPKGTMFWGIATITVPSVILTGYYLYGAPEDEREEYLEIPQWQKDMFWVFKQDGEWRRIPKPFSFGYLFGSVPERFMHWGYQGEKPEMKKFWQEFVGGIAGTISPVNDASSLLPPLMKMTIEDLTNYNFFTGRDIYPEWMDRYDPEERYNKYTSETSKAVGGTIGVSPALLDNTARGLFAGASAYALDAGDAILKQVREWNGEEVPEDPVTPSDVPVIKAFSVREPTGYQANSVSNFFDNWKDVSQAKATYDSKDGEEKQAYLEKNETRIQNYSTLKSYYDRIKEIGKMSDSVYQDTSMSSKEKVETLSDYGDQILDIAKEANKTYGENIN